MNNATLISLSEIRRDASSYVDPQGFVFHYQGKIYRLIQGPSVELFSKLLDSGLLRKLCAEHGLVNAEKTDYRLEGSPHGLVIRHDTIWPLSYCVDWCPSQLREAAVTTLELSLALLDHGLMLQDAYPWNVLFDGTHARFVDLTSLIEEEHGVIWPAREQFDAFFLRPLVLSAQGKGKVVRALLQDNISGIGLEDFYRLTSSGYRISHPGLTAVRWLDRRIQSSTQLKERVREISERGKTQITPTLRKRYFSSLLRKVESFQFGRADDPWTRYYSDIDESFDKEAKLSAVRKILNEISPSTVLDLGSNTGVFSIEAARVGAKVISVDSSEECAECVYAAAKSGNLPITPFVTDIVAPTPPFGFMGTQYDNVWKRARSHTVMCLGLMHHLHINGRQSFERIAKLLDTVSHKHLIFEFVGLNDANIPHLSTRRPIDYNLESVMQALRQYFPLMEVQASDRESRRLLVCSK